MFYNTPYSGPFLFLELYISIYAYPLAELKR